MSSWANFGMISNGNSALSQDEHTTGATWVVAKARVLLMTSRSAGDTSDSRSNPSWLTDDDSPRYRLWITGAAGLTKHSLNHFFHSFCIYYSFTLYGQPERPQLNVSTSSFGLELFIREHVLTAYRVSLELTHRPSFTTYTSSSKGYSMEQGACRGCIRGVRRLHAAEHALLFKPTTCACAACPLHLHRA